MIKHVVAFRFNPEVSESHMQSIFDELNTFPQLYPAMREWTLGPNISRRDTTMSHAFTVQFETRDELDAYLTGSPHETFVRDTWRPVIAQQTIVTIEAPS